MIVLGVSRKLVVLQLYIYVTFNNFSFQTFNKGKLKCILIEKPLRPLVFKDYYIYNLIIQLKKYTHYI